MSYKCVGKVHFIAKVKTRLKYRIVDFKGFFRNPSFRAYILV